MGNDEALDDENVVITESSVVDDNEVLLGVDKYVVEKISLPVDVSGVPVN